MVNIAPCVQKTHHAHQQEHGDEAANLRESVQGHQDRAGEHVVLEGAASRPLAPRCQ